VRFLHPVPALLAPLLLGAGEPPCTAPDPAAGLLEDLTGALAGPEAPDADCDEIENTLDPTFDGPVTVTVEAPWTDGVYSWTGRFDLTSTGPDTATATVCVLLEGARNAAREAAWERAAEAVWRVGGLTLDLVFTDDPAVARHRVTVRPGEGWSNVQTWFAGEGGLVVAHEVGHLLGLPDGYPDPLVPARPLDPEDSIMRTVDSGVRPHATEAHAAAVLGRFTCP
jgi:hypothetical protein